MGRIPCLVGAAEPSFWTRDRRWMGFDTLILETCAELERQDVLVSPIAVKAAVQVARSMMRDPRPLEGDALFVAVATHLRHRRVLLPAVLVGVVLTAYTRAVLTADIAEVRESD